MWTPSFTVSTLLTYNLVCWCTEPKTMKSVFMTKYFDCTVIGLRQGQITGVYVTLTLSKGEPLIFHRRVLGFLSRDCKTCGTTAWDVEGKRTGRRLYHAPTLTRVFPLTIKCRFITDPQATQKSVTILTLYALQPAKLNTNTYLMYLFVSAVSLGKGPNHKTRMWLGFGGDDSEASKITSGRVISIKLLSCWYYLVWDIPSHIHAHV